MRSSGTRPRTPPRSPRRRWRRSSPKPSRSCSRAATSPSRAMVSLDEPEHARLRKPAARAFSMKRVTAMIPTIEATTARLLDAVADADRVRPGRRAGVPAPGQHRVLPDGGARAGLRPGQAVVRVPGGAEFRAPRGRGPGRDRHDHGRLPQVHARPGGRQGPRARRRPGQRPDRHPPRGPGAAHPGRDRLDLVLAVVRRARDHHRAHREHRPPPARGPQLAGRTSSSTRT